jgi:hypothetical protein
VAGGVIWNRRRPATPTVRTTCTVTPLNTGDDGADGTCGTERTPAVAAAATTSVVSPEAPAVPAPAPAAWQVPVLPGSAHGRGQNQAQGKPRREPCCLRFTTPTILRRPRRQSRRQQSSADVHGRGTRAALAGGAARGGAAETRAWECLLHQRLSLRQRQQAAAAVTATSHTTANHRVQEHEQEHEQHGKKKHGRQGRQPAAAGPAATASRSARSATQRAAVQGRAAEEVPIDGELQHGIVTSRDDAAAAIQAHEPQAVWARLGVLMGASPDETLETLRPVGGLGEGGQTPHVLLPTIYSPHRMWGPPPPGLDLVVTGGCPLCNVGSRRAGAGGGGDQPATAAPGRSSSHPRRPAPAAASIRDAAVDVDGSLACFECLRAHCEATGLSIAGSPMQLRDIRRLRAHLPSMEPARRAPRLSSKLSLDPEY